MPTIIPVASLDKMILVFCSMCAMSGVALGAFGLLGTRIMGLTIDTFNLASDNGGDIAEGRTDVLDTVVDWTLKGAVTPVKNQE